MAGRNVKLDGAAGCFDGVTMRKKGSVTRKINTILILSLTVGIGAAVAYYAVTQNVNILNAMESNLVQQSDILYQSIKNAMLPGQAPLAVSLLNDIREINPAYEIKLYRANGVEAFSDNTTIEAVNATIGQDTFKLRDTSSDARIAASEEQIFRGALSMGRDVKLQESVGARSFYSMYSPLLNIPKCTRCHGTDHTIRGIIKIRSDITPTVAKQRNNLIISSSLFVGIVLILTFILTFFIHGSIINPVKHIGLVCSLVTEGDFSPRVEVKSGDEIGQLGETVNTMVEGLYERFELSKFVSASTLDSLRDHERGAKERITVLFSDVRGFTAFSEKRTPEEVVDSLNRILNIQTEIIHRCGGDVDKYVGDEVVALFSGEEQAYNACESAFEIQRELVEGRDRRYDSLQVGIGINTGEVILGMIGSEKRADFTVIGDHVNLGSRLCNTARPGATLISNNTYQLVKDVVSVSKPYKLKVKGKENYQIVYLLEGVGPRAIETESNTIGREKA